MDYSNTHIPNLKVFDAVTHTEFLLTNNTSRTIALAQTFFHPPPTTPNIPMTVYPKPLRAKGTFTRDDIKVAISKLKPNKAPGLDGIQNIVIQDCANTIIDNLFYIYQAILRLHHYPSCWLTSLTIVLCKPGKPAYNIAKAYRPIGLLNTLGKLFSTLVASDLSFLTEKHHLLPPTQFDGHPGCCTMDTMHPVTKKIKDTWRKKKTASVLFLDIQAVFPNTVKDHLLHNMKSRQVPEVYICLIDNMLSKRQTQLHFDDFISKPITINNGTTQGCPLLMLIYAYYNTNLIDIVRGKHKLSTGFVDDCMFMATGDTIEDTQ